MKVNIAKVIVAGLMIGFALMVADAQTRPDLNGTWKLDRVESKFLNPDRAPKDLVVRFEQRGEILRETLTVLNSGGKSTVSLNYALDGKENLNNLEGEKITTTAKWSGNVLVLEWKDDGGTFTRRITFSDNSGTIRINVHDTNPDGEPDDLIVLGKQ